MKKLLFATMVTILIAASSFTASANDNMPNLKEFNAALNRTAKVSWKYTNSFHKASMEMNGVQSETFFTPDGEFMASSKTFDFDKLPQAALKTLTSRYAYPNYSLEECIAIENADHEVNYYVSLIKTNKKIVVQISTDGTVSEIPVLK